MVLPVYTYRVREGAGCEVCSDRFEVTQPMSEAPLERCPHCQSAVFRLIVAVNVVSGVNFGDGLSRERLKKSGLKKLVRDDSGNYVDDTPK